MIRVILGRARGYARVGVFPLRYMRCAIVVLGACVIPVSGLTDTLKSVRDCGACPEMIKLPMDDFVMGAPLDEFRRNLVWRDGAYRSQIVTSEWLAQMLAAARDIFHRLTYLPTETPNTKKEHCTT